MTSRPKFAARPGWKKIDGRWEFDPDGAKAAAAGSRPRGRPKGEGGWRENGGLPVHAMANARVIDIKCFNLMKGRNETAGRVAKWLGVSTASAQMLLDGEHWQQDPVRIAQFNEYRGTSIPTDGPGLGVAPPDVIERYGGASGKRKIQRTPGEQWTVDAVKRAGVHPDQAVQVAQKMAALAGKDVPLSERLDTQFFLEQTEEKLAKFLRALDDGVIATMSGNDLVKAYSVFVEKRALLRGEPTQIVSHRQRESIDRVLPLVVEAARKRGITIDGTAKRIEEAK